MVVRKIYGTCSDMNKGHEKALNIVKSLISAITLFEVNSGNSAIATKSTMHSLASQNI